MPNNKAKAAVQFDAPGAYAVGRNGTRDIKGVDIWEGDGLAYIDYITKPKGLILSGGAGIPVEAMDELAKQWLEERGKLPKEEAK